MVVRNIKIIFIGEKESGKSSLITTYMFGHPILHRKPLLFGSYCKVEIIDDQEFQLNICDTSGEQEFLRLQSMSYLDADLLVLCVDATKNNGLMRSREYAKIIKTANVPSVLCLTKSDIPKSIREEEIKEFVKAYNMNSFVYSTINDNREVKKAFETIIYYARSSSLVKESNFCGIFQCCC